MKTPIKLLLTKHPDRGIPDRDYELSKITGAITVEIPGREIRAGDRFGEAVAKSLMRYSYDVTVVPEKI
jgi:hypothetical protein